MESFTPAGANKGSNGNYMKIEQGENRVRVLSQPSEVISGFEYWTEVDGKPKPVRVKEMPKEEPANLRRNQFKPDVWADSVVPFTAFVVWDRATKQIRILSITKLSIMGQLDVLLNDEEWGYPSGYDLKITKEGQKMETKYTVSPCKPSELEEEIVEMYKAMEINLDALWTGEDPFANSPKVEEVLKDPKTGEELPCNINNFKS